MNLRMLIFTGSLTVAMLAGAGVAADLGAIDALFEAGDHAEALAEMDVLVSEAPGNRRLLNLRGMYRFRSGNIAGSLADFDRVVELEPQIAPYHWQRGISLYYAGRYAEGARQFELHRSVNPNDVENAVWHFLCVNRHKGFEAARKVLIPIKGDPRVPMMRVHSLFAGEATPEDVLGDARNEQGPRARLALFYARLYLGLYYEALGDDTASLEQILLAADDSMPHGYMHDVARVHRDQRLKKAKAEQADPIR